MSTIIPRFNVRCSVLAFYVFALNVAGRDAASRDGCAAFVESLCPNNFWPPWYVIQEVLT